MADRPGWRRKAARWLRRLFGIGRTGASSIFRRNYRPTGLLNVPREYEDVRSLWSYYPRRGSDPMAGRRAARKPDEP